MRSAIAIVGPSGSGKTAAALQLAKERKGTLICCDSLQLYEGFVIGSGRPTVEELGNVETALYGSFSAHSGYIGPRKYTQLALQAIEAALMRNNMPVLEGCNSAYANELSMCEKNVK